MHISVLLFSRGALCELLVQRVCSAVHSLLFSVELFFPCCFQVVLQFFSTNCCLLFPIISLGAHCEIVCGARD